MLQSDVVQLPWFWERERDVVHSDWFPSSAFHGDNRHRLQFLDPNISPLVPVVRNRTSNRGL